MLKETRLLPLPETVLVTPITEHCIEIVALLMVWFLRKAVWWDQTAYYSKGFTSKTKAKIMIR